MATPNGLEPSTSSVTGWRANRLHHRARTVEIITDEMLFVKRKKAKNSKFLCCIWIFVKEIPLVKPADICYINSINSKKDR